MDQIKKREEEIVDQWMDAWMNKNLGNDYASAKNFRNFWLKECPGLQISSAYKLYEKTTNLEHPKN